jgi:hypothetical protein
MPDAKDPDVIAYKQLRTAIGLLAFFFPYLLILGGILVCQEPPQPSISDYYYCCVRNIFVGMLCSIGVFMFSYRGYLAREYWLSKLASVTVIAVAFFPTTPGDPTSREKLVGAIHLFCAAVFFLILAYMSFFLFTRHGRRMTAQKHVRNLIYRICGLAIFLSVLIIGGVKAAVLLDSTFTAPARYMLFFETIAILAFAISWMVKADGFTWLNDRRPGASSRSPRGFLRFSGF